MGRENVAWVVSDDPVLSLVSSVGLAAVSGTGLVVDLAAETVPGARTLADLHLDGPSSAELSPGRTGVAYLAGGPIPVGHTHQLLQRLASSWPTLVIRGGEVTPREFGMTIPVRALHHGWLMPHDAAPAVWQPIRGMPKPPGPGPVLPKLPSALANRLVSGVLPRRSRWISAWSRIWEMPWA